MSSLAHRLVSNFDTICNCPNPSLIDIFTPFGLSLSSFPSRFLKRSTRKKFSHSYKECFILLSNRCWISHILLSQWDHCLSCSCCLWLNRAYDYVGLNELAIFLTLSHRGESNHWVGHAVKSCFLYSWSLGVLYHERPSVIPRLECVQSSFRRGIVFTNWYLLLVFDIKFIFISLRSYRAAIHVFRVSDWWKTAGTVRVTVQIWPTRHPSTWKMVLWCSSFGWCWKSSSFCVCQQ